MGCDGGRTQQGGFLVHDDSYRDRAQQTLVSPFGGERAHEGTVLEFADELGRDAAAEVDAAQGHGLQGQVAGLRTVDGRKEVEGLNGNLSLFLEAGRPA